MEGKFSLLFLAALALAEGHVTLDKFTDEKVNDPRLVKLRGKVKAHLKRELKFGARVEVKMKDGTTYKEFRKTPKGDPANPLSFEEITMKFKNTAKLAVSEKNIELLIEKVKALENLTDPKEIVSLTKV